MHIIGLSIIAALNLVGSVKSGLGLVHKDHSCSLLEFDSVGETAQSSPDGLSFGCVKSKADPIRR
jgi:hypothetical protein